MRSERKSLRVAVQVRPDHAQKSGGDIAIAKAFVVRLQALGADVVLCDRLERLDVERPDWVLAFNLDQPLELLTTARAARRARARVAVYTLHHPTAGVRTYLQHGATGWRGRIARLIGREPARYFHALGILRQGMRRDPAAAEFLLKGRRRLVAEMVELLDALLVSCPSERSEIAEDYSGLHAIPSVIVPHPIAVSHVTLPDANAYPSSARKHFFIAGRIESRKNQVSVVRIARRFPDAEFVFAGQVNATDSHYGDDFQRQLAANPNCRWLGHVQLPVLLQHIRDADAVIASSWFEVMSLINLYAYALGTPVVSSCHTYDADVIERGVVRYDPADPESLVRALNAIPARVAVRDIAELESRCWREFDRFWRAQYDRRISSERNVS